MLNDVPASALQWAGHLGVAFYLGGYAALQAGLIRGNSVAYTLINLAAAALVLLSLTAAFNLSSALVQIFWIVISIIGLIRIALQNSWVRFTETERAFIEDALPDMPRPMARRFLNAGTWHEAPPGTELTREAEPVANLHYVAAGTADVIAGGRRIAEVDRGFIGEMNVLKGGPASATVTMREPGLVFTISRKVLLRLRERDGDLRLILDHGLTSDTAAKLTRANRRLADTDAAE